MDDRDLIVGENSMVDQQIFSMRELLVEIISDNAVFSDLCDSIQKVFGENLDSAIDQLQRVRFPNQDDDIEIQKNIVRLLGFDVTEDFQTLNFEIYKVYNIFSEYYTTAHTDSFYRFLSFVLGREVKVDPLYTSDYRNFYPEPLGELLINGGDWYQTTHVDLVVAISNLRGKLLAHPGKKYYNRVIDLFYEYAPIQLVLKRLWFLTVVESDPLSYVGTIIVERKSATAGGKGTHGGQDVDQLESIEIEGNSFIVENTTHRYSLKLKWLDGFQENLHYCTFLSNSSLLDITNYGVATAASVIDTENVVIAAHYGGKAATKNIAIITDTIFVKSIVIDGSDIVDEDTTNLYGALVKWSDGSITNVNYSNDVEWKVIRNPNSVASFLNAHYGNLSVQSIATDTVVIKIFVSYTFESKTVYDAKTIKIQNVANDVTLRSITIEGAVNVYENSAYSYRCLAEFSNHSKNYITPEWYLKSSAATISNDGTLQTNETVKDLTFTLRASYTNRKITCNDDVKIRLHHVTLTIVSGNIIGPETVQNRDSYQYNLSIGWSDGSFSLIKPDRWYTTHFEITKDGLLKVGSVDGYLLLEITVHFSYHEAIYEYSKIVRVLSSFAVCDCIIIRGTQSLKFEPDSECTVKLRAFAHYSDGNRIQLTNPTWLIGVEYASIVADVNGTATLTIHSIPNSTKITVSVIDNVSVGYQIFSEMTAIHDIFVTMSIPTVDRIAINDGIVTMLEQTSEEFFATAYKSDGTSEAIVPNWSFTCTETAYKEEDIGSINYNGKMTIRLLEAPTIILLKASFFGKEATKKISLEKYSYPLKAAPYNSSVEGPNLVDFNLGYSQYSMYIQQNAYDTMSAVSAEWSINVDEDHACIDEYGTVHVLKYIATDAIITAVYTWGYQNPVIATKQINLPGAIDAGVLEITGPNFVYDDSSTEYFAHMLRTDGTRIDVTNLIDSKWSITKIKNVNRSHVILEQGKLIIPKLSVNDNITIVVKYSEEANLFTGTQNVSILTDVPKFGFGPFGLLTQTDFESVCTNLLSRNPIVNFSITIPEGSYGYFMYPKSYGLATFTNADNLDVGGWDGATWPVDDIGTSFDPIVVDFMYNTILIQYNVHRTDFTGSGLLENYHINYT